MARYDIRFDAQFDNIPQGEWWLEVREVLGGDWHFPPPWREVRERLPDDWDDATPGRQQQLLDELLGDDWDAGHQWEVLYEFLARDGEPVLTRVELKPFFPAMPGGGVTARLLRQISVPDAYNAARAYIARQLELVEAGDYVEAVRHQTKHSRGDEQWSQREVERFVRQLRDWTPTPDKWPARAAGYLSAETLNAPRRPGRRGRDDKFFAELAAEYVDIVKSGSHRPVVDLAGRLGYSPDHTRDLLNQARNRELLSRPREGRAEGHLLPKAIKLVEKHAADPPVRDGSRRRSASSARSS